MRRASKQQVPKEEAGEFSPDTLEQVMRGRVLNPILTPGNWDGQEPALTLIQSVKGGAAGRLGLSGG